MKTHLLKTTTGVLLAAFTLAPVLGTVTAAYAAGPAAVMATKANVAPVATLDPMIGKWTPQQVADLPKAKTVTIAEVKETYSPADQKTIQTTVDAQKTALGTLRDSLSKDAALKAWFDSYKVDINHLIAISDDGKGGIVLYVL